MASEVDNQFVELVAGLQMEAMFLLGKMAHPLTGKVERDLGLAKRSIDLLEMIERKTRGNLTSDEKNLIEHILFELHLNYVDEVTKDQKNASGEGRNQAEGGEQTAGQAGSGSTPPE